MRIIGTLLLCCLITSLSAQKKVMQHEDKALWNRIVSPQIANNGNYVLFETEKGEKDKTLHIKTTEGTSLLSYSRTKGARFTYDSDYAVFTVNAWKDSIKELKRKKVKSKDLPKDTLVIIEIQNQKLLKIPNVKSYQIPKKWSGIVSYLLEPEKESKNKKKDDDDSTNSTKVKKVSKDNGYHLVIQALNDGSTDTIKFVKTYQIAEKAKIITYVTTGDDKTQAGVYQYDVQSRKKTVLFESHDKTKYPQLSISTSGSRIAFVVDADTTKAQIHKPSLMAWKSNDTKASEIVQSENNERKLLVSGDAKLLFSKDENRLFFGLRTEPILQDPDKLDEEIVNVEVWTYDEPRLYTVQELDVKKDQKKSFLTLYDFKQKKMIPIANEEYDVARYSDEGNGAYAVIANATPYQLESQWTAQLPMDLKRVDLTTGKQREIAKKVYGGTAISPKGNYLYGYSRKDTTWFTYNLKTLKYTALTKGKPFYNELHDYPDDPRGYGAAGWTDNDEAFLIYDRFDIWAFDPETGSSENLTKGRANKIRYRYLRLDAEERSISSKSPWMLSTFNEENKEGGFAVFNPKSNTVKSLVSGPFSYGRPILAQQDKKNRLMFTRESFTEFPNIWTTTTTFTSPKQISDVNPQQSEYNWGTAELVNWMSLDGKPLTGMLIKPENFDPNKKYPMIVNFYEKSSDGLYRHRAPSYGRSTINYPFYASRGYLIFNPDVHYREGYPGESALNCVIPGITALIDKGFVDKDNIGVQGHSWGGYQIAYLVTKTDIFKAAESGAPVPNMISAYGGIRWWTGLSRQFQYEHTQSRIGGTPWEYPQRYIENSPIFTIDKINTPLLIMHNDADGHVPWYQGIEFFVSLRRLGKPSWFLNYNGEPHWPLKLQNRIDFNIRMAQFFDHYLKGAPKPIWMERGVPAIEKGIHQGLELMNSKE